jgi:signal-transduction protein with cAMP-binding, CBS, and nucleotidyltransferase domain
MVTKIRAACFHPPMFATIEMSIREAALAMKANKTNLMPAKRNDKIGIITATDLREAASFSSSRWMRQLGR